MARTTSSINYNTNLNSMIANYIYFYHLKKFVILPAFSTNSVTDNVSSTFLSTDILQRTAPIWSYSHSGPRSLQVLFKLHRDMMNELNAENTPFMEDFINLDKKLNEGEDAVDRFIRYAQTAVLPEYDASTKLVNPPMVALRMSNEIYIKGIVNGTVGITYNYPIINSGNNIGKFSNIDVALDIIELDPYQASDIVQMGSYRGLDTSIERQIYG